ncbi:MAG: FecR domain-containing protein, partial [Acidobacteriota bacterium]
MKRIVFRLSLILLVLAARVVLAATEPVGKVDLVSGEVALEREGGSQAARPGDSTFLGDRIKTGKDGSIEIVFLDSSRVKLAPNADLVINEYLYKPQDKTREGLLTVASGKARFLVQDLQDFKDKRFRVQTQTAVVGTRDTDFAVSAEPGGVTRALCVENVILMSTGGLSGPSVLLTANMISQVTGRNAPTPPRFA